MRISPAALPIIYCHSLSECPACVTVSLHAPGRSAAPASPARHCRPPRSGSRPAGSLYTAVCTVSVWYLAEPRPLPHRPNAPGFLHKVGLLFYSNIDVDLGDYSALNYLTDTAPHKRDFLVAQQLYISVCVFFIFIFSFIFMSTKCINKPKIKTNNYL